MDLYLAKAVISKLPPISADFLLAELPALILWFYLEQPQAVDFRQGLSPKLFFRSRRALVMQFAD